MNQKPIETILPCFLLGSSVFCTPLNANTAYFCNLKLKELLQSPVFMLMGVWVGWNSLKWRCTPLSHSCPNYCQHNPPVLPVLLPAFLMSCPACYVASDQWTMVQQHLSSVIAISICDIWYVHSVSTKTLALRSIYRYHYCASLPTQFACHTSFQALYLKLLICSMPLWLATFVACSRLHDYKHDFADVNAGRCVTGHDHDHPIIEVRYLSFFRWWGGHTVLWPSVSFPY